MATSGTGKFIVEILLSSRGVDREMDQLRARVDYGGEDARR